MSDEKVEIIKRILIDDLFVELPAERIGLEDGLQSVHGLDSVAFAELRMLCERHFNVDIRDEDFTPDNFRNVQVLVQLIDRLQLGQARAAG